MNGDTSTPCDSCPLINLFYWCNMKWFKHFSDARHDEFITWLRAEYGMEGVGRWWTLLEVVGEQMSPKGNGCSAKHPRKEWCAFLKQKQNKMNLFLKQIENKSKIKLIEHENVLEIKIPKMLELRDNYSRNLQAACNPNPCELASPLLLTSTSPENNKLISNTIEETPFDYACKIDESTGEVLN